MAKAKVLIVEYEGNDLAGALKAAFSQLEETQIAEEAKWKPHCPACGAPMKTRERRPNGNDTCEGGHTYPSANSVYK